MAACHPAGIQGIGLLASGSMERMRRLYVRENGVNRPIGYICDQDDVVLDAPASGPRHVLTKTLPAQVICLATGEAVSAVDGSMNGPVPTRDLAG